MNKDVLGFLPGPMPGMVGFIPLGKFNGFTPIRRLYNPFLHARRTKIGTFERFFREPAKKTRLNCVIIRKSDVISQIA